MEEQYVMINPPNAGEVPAPPPVAPHPPAPAPPGAGPYETGSTLLQTKTNLKSEVKISADQSVIPDSAGQDFGDSTFTNPMPPVDSKSQLDTVTERPGKKRSVLWTAIFGALTGCFLIIAVVGGLGVAKMFGEKSE